MHCLLPAAAAPAARVSTALTPHVQPAGLTRHAGSLHSLEIVLGAPTNALAESKAAQVGARRNAPRPQCLACVLDALQGMHLSWGSDRRVPLHSSQVELGRCLAVVCVAGAVQRLAVRWLGKTQLKLGPELAACGECSSLRILTIDGNAG